MKIDNSKVEMFYEIKQLKQERVFWVGILITFLVMIMALLLFYPKPCQEVVEKTYLNDKYLFCEHHGGIYSSHGNDECAFGEYPNDIYPSIKIKKGEWNFKNPTEVLEYFVKNTNYGE